MILCGFRMITDEGRNDVNRYWLFVNRKMKIKTFEDLDVWKICRDIRQKLAKLVKEFPQEERYRLTDQILRAARSATANLAEGYGRFYYQENIQFSRQSRGSLYELLDHLSVALDDGLITKDQFVEFRRDILKAATVVNGYIRYLNEAKGQKEDQGSSTNND